MTIFSGIKSSSSGQGYSLAWHRYLIQKVKDKYELEEGMRVIHTVFGVYGLGIISSFEVNSGEVTVIVEWPNIGDAGCGKIAKHVPSLLAKIDIDKNDRSGPNQGFKVRKYLLNKDKHDF